MAAVPNDSFMDPNLVSITMGGLRKPRDPLQKVVEGHIKGIHVERILLHKTTALLDLWAQIRSLGYQSPDLLRIGENSWKKEDARKVPMHPFVQLEVVADRPSEIGKTINIHDPFVRLADQNLLKEIFLDINKQDSSTSGISADSLKDDGGLEITFHRTIRMPDDDRLHQLPGSLGVFPLYNVHMYHERLPADVSQQGGVFLPMWQREALWIQFSAPPPLKYALRISVGRINAVSGQQLDEGAEEDQSRAKVQDYVVVPGQQWLDGICVEPGVVRQFIAMPLGSGYTVEGQKTGSEKFGGLQIEIIPSYEQHLRNWFQESAESDDTHTSKKLDELKTPWELGLKAGEKIRSCPPYLTVSDFAEECTAIAADALYQEVELLESMSTERYARAPRNDTIADDELSRWAGADPSPLAKPSWNSEPGDARKPQAIFEETCSFEARNVKIMGLAAGGKLVQDIYQDSSPARIWNFAASRLVHVHLLNPATFEKVTHVIPPPPPIDAMGYIEADKPFYVVEEQVDNRVDGGDFGNVKSVSAMDKVVLSAKQVASQEEPSYDPSTTKTCKKCEVRLCDCIIRPCNHEFCNVCIKELDQHDDHQDPSTSISTSIGTGTGSQHDLKQWKCPTCGNDVSHVAGFSAPMNLPGEEALRTKVNVHVLKVEDGRVQFKSIQSTRV